MDPPPGVLEQEAGHVPERAGGTRLRVLEPYWSTGHDATVDVKIVDEQVVVVDDRGCERDRVEAIQHAAVAWEDPARVLHAGRALDQRLREITELAPEACPEPQLV